MSLRYFFFPLFSSNIFVIWMDRNGRPAHGGAMRSEGDYGDFSKKIMNYIKFRLVTMKKYPNIIESFALFGTLLFFFFGT